MVSIYKWLNDELGNRECCHVTCRTFHRLGKLGEDLQPLAELLGEEKPFLAQFQVVINSTADYLETFVVDACDTRQQLLAVFERNFSELPGGLQNALSHDYFTLGLKEAPTPTEFTDDLISLMNTPMKIGRFLNMLDQCVGTIQRA